MNKHLTIRTAVVTAVVLLTGVAAIELSFGGIGHGPKRHFPNSPPRPVPGAGAQFGDPLPDLTPDQQAAFEAGREEFESEESPADGLGPVFNNVSCVACHSGPATGGASAITETRFGRFANGQFDPLAALGGSLLQQMAIDPVAQEVVPPEANVVALRQTTSLFGIGLIEAIPDIEIRLNAQRRKPDGIKGTISLVHDVVSGQSRVGRFGWKAQQATVLAFAADAYLNEMGITSRFFPTENAPNGNAALLAQFDKVADPEDAVDPATGTGDIDKSANFTRLLAPPPPLRLTEAASAGRRLFEQVGCASCHTPVMFTGPSKIAAIRFKVVPLYSDLLLHDMGSLGDGIVQGTAGQRDMKTPPLWGLRASAPYLHDGRATTIDEAIRAHEGEAAPVRDRYGKLSPAQQQHLLEFLNSI